LIIRNMATPSQSMPLSTAFEKFCDIIIIFALCAAIFVLPASIAYLDSFIGLAVFFYMLKKIIGIFSAWNQEARHLKPLAKMRFILKGFAPVPNVLGLPLLLLTMAMLVAVIMSQYPMLSLVAFFGKFLKGVFAYFSFLEVFNHERRVKVFLILLMASSFIMVIDGAFQHKTGKDFFKKHQISKIQNISSGRISGSFGDENGLGAYLLIPIALALHFFSRFLGLKKWGLMAICGFLLVFLLVCLCWTYSRSSWLGLLFMLVSMAILDWRKIVLALIILAFFVSFFLPALSKVRHMHLINDTDSESQEIFDQSKSPSDKLLDLIRSNGSGRYAYWQKAISIIRSSPIYGTGLNTYTKIIERNPDKSTWWYAHNSYLQMAAETGILGLGCFLFMLFVLFRHGLIYCSQIHDPWILNALQGVLTGIFALFVQSFLDNTLYTVQLSMFMWLMIGMAVALTQLEPSRIKS